MKTRQLGNTDIEVTEICLGTMTWGEQNDQQQAFEQMDYALDYGVNFFDTAEMYAVPPTEKTYGTTETIIGNWFAERGNRDKVILASKASGPGMPHIRDGSLLDRENLNKAIEASLQRLQTDYIDLYQIHWPGRTTNYFGQLGYKHNASEPEPNIEEMVEALDELVKSGKIRHYGLSNETAWGTMKYVMEANSKGKARPVSIQNPYSLLNRSFEVGLAEVAHREHVGLLAYSPLAFGTLSGKYRNGAKPENCRLTLWERFSRYTNPQATAATEKYCALAEESGLTPAQMSLAYVTSRPFVTSNIIGATSMEQLKENLGSSEVTLDKELLGKIEDIHTEYVYPSP